MAVRADLGVTRQNLATAKRLGIFASDPVGAVRALLLNASNGFRFVFVLQRAAQRIILGRICVASHGNNWDAGQTEGDSFEDATA